MSTEMTGMSLVKSTVWRFDAEDRAADGDAAAVR